MTYISLLLLELYLHEFISRSTQFFLIINYNILIFEKVILLLTTIYVCDNIRSIDGDRHLD